MESGFFVVEYKLSRAIQMKQIKTNFHQQKGL
jgi:hypothetical protein